MIIIHTMNDHGKHDLLPRFAAISLAKHLKTMPAVVLTGARQTGKSTLARIIAGEGRAYYTLDDIDIVDLARNDPDALVGGRVRITLDEIQREPNLLLAVKRAIDRDRQPGRFLLTGSANLLMMNRVSESLAGPSLQIAGDILILHQLSMDFRSRVGRHLLHYSPDLLVAQ